MTTTRSPHPQVAAMLAMLDQLGVPELSSLGPVEARALLDQLAAALGQGEDVSEVRDLAVPGPGGAIAARLYRPIASATTDVLPVVVYFHGGGWVIGSMAGYDRTCRALANRFGTAIVSVDYRLAPEHPFPAGLDDAWAATRWVADHAGELGADAGRLAVMGDSAGGNLAAVVSLLARDAGSPAIDAQLLVYPVTDIRMGFPSIEENATGFFLTKADMEYFRRHYGVGRVVDADDWRVSPLLAPSHAGLPPALVITAELDPLRDEGNAYAGALEAAGVATTRACYEGMVHGFFGFYEAVDAGREAHQQCAEALRSAFATT